MHRQLTHIVKPVISAVLFVAALWLLRDVLREYHYHEIVTALRSIPVLDLLLCFALTLGGYLALVGYDLVALHYIGRPLPFRKAAGIAFISYAVANSAPASVLTGGGVRYRLYSSLGLSAVDTAKVSAFDVITYSVGLLTLGGLVFLVEPLALPRSIPLPFASARPLGSLFLLAVAGYVLLVAIRMKPIRIRRWEFEIPSARLVLAQMGVSSLDWIFSGGALYVLLFRVLHVSFPEFLGLFLLAQLVTLISPLPGGLGVFEAVILLLRPAGSSAAAAFGALLAYRVVYYLLPLASAAILLGIRTIRTRRTPMTREPVGTWQYSSRSSPRPKWDSWPTRGSTKS